MLGFGLLFVEFVDEDVPSDLEENKSITEEEDIEKANASGEDAD